VDPIRTIASRLGALRPLSICPKIVAAKSLYRNLRMRNCFKSILGWFRSPGASTVNLHFKSAAEIARLIRERHVSAVDALEHFLARVEKYNPHLNAIVWLDAAGARERARAADAALDRGDNWGPLHGVPMTIKESYNVAGAPTTWGDPKLKDNVTTTSALAVERLKKAGVVLFGKTNVPLMLADNQSYNAIYGTTNNPWDMSRTPGGSSGGAAAAVAAGLTGLDAGSDIGSSIRSPAHFCGVFGLKSTWGVASPKGQALPNSYSYSDLSVIGPLARSAEDLQIALDVMAGPDEIDGIAWNVGLPAGNGASLKDFRVAVKLSDPNCEVETEYVDKLQALVEELARRGAKVSQAEPQLDTTRLHEVYLTLLRAATSSRVTDDDIERWRKAQETLGPGQNRYLDLLLRGSMLSHREWLRLNNERHGLRRAFAAFFEDYDVLLCPVGASAAPPHNHEGETWQRTITVNGKSMPSTNHLFWAGYATLVFLPATTGPIGTIGSGLPIGYQAIAASGRDKTAIAFSPRNRDGNRRLRSSAGI
jgi:amidase